MKNNIKFLIIFTSILSIIFYNLLNVSAEDCPYLWEIEQCKSANDSWTTKSIEDFVCIIWTDEEIVYQIVLDKLFKKIDDEMDKYIEDLENEKDRYYWIWRQKNFIDWLNEIDQKKKYFYEKYANLCWVTIIQESMSCLADNKTSISTSKKFYQESDCMKLVDKKLEIYDEVTFSIMMLNKEQIKADEKKTYVQWERENYDTLLDLMMVNLWYVERIWQKWPSKIQNTY